MLFKPQSYQPSASESQLKTKWRTLKPKPLTSKKRGKKKNVFIAGGTVGPPHHLNLKRPGGTTECLWFQSLGSMWAGSLMRCFLFNARVENTCLKNGSSALKGIHKWHQPQGGRPLTLFVGRFLSSRAENTVLWMIYLLSQRSTPFSSNRHQTTSPYSEPSPHNMELRCYYAYQI